MASSENCCCEEDSEEGVVPPSGPDCGCPSFANCTVTVSYDGLTVTKLHRNLVAEFWYKSAGQYGFRISPGLIGNPSIDRVCLINSNDVCTAAPRAITGSCGVPNTSALYHLDIAYGTNNRAANSFHSYYRYNVDADPSQPCPNSVAGKTITVSEVARMPTGSVNPSECGKSCRQILESFRAVSGAFFEYLPNFSYTWGNIVWAPYQGSPNVPGNDPLRGQYITPVADEEWPCQLPLYDQQRPQVSVVCPP